MIMPQYKTNENTSVFAAQYWLTESSSPVREGFSPNKNSKVADHLNHNTSSDVRENSVILQHR